MREKHVRSCYESDTPHFTYSELWYLRMVYPWISMRDSISTCSFRIIGATSTSTLFPPQGSEAEDAPNFFEHFTAEKIQKNMRIWFGLTWRLQQNGDHSKPDFDFAWFLSSEWSCSEIRDSANDKVWRFLASHDKNFLWSQHFWDIHHSEKNDPWYHVIPINNCWLTNQRGNFAHGSYDIPIHSSPSTEQNDDSTGEKRSSASGACQSFRRPPNYCFVDFCLALGYQVLKSIFQFQQTKNAMSGFLPPNTVAPNPLIPGEARWEPAIPRAEWRKSVDVGLRLKMT